jgi:hypothetical protein
LEKPNQNNNEFANLNHRLLARNILLPKGKSEQNGNFTEHPKMSWPALRLISRTNKQTTWKQDKPRGKPNKTDWRNQKENKEKDNEGLKQTQTCLLSQVEAWKKKSKIKKFENQTIKTAWSERISPKKNLKTLEQENGISQIKQITERKAKNQPKSKRQRLRRAYRQETF